jgi:hypothetical protein
MELQEALDVLARARLISRRQWLAALQLLQPMLPVSFTIDMRTPKGTMYVITPRDEYVVNNRAKLQKNS